MSAKDATTQVEYVAQIFDEMVNEYDDLLDLWYSYTFGTIRRVLLREFSNPPGNDSKALALDVGCGTGIQSFDLAKLGYRVVGIDVAKDLLKRAHAKLKVAGLNDADFLVADAQWLPFRDSISSCANCCGPTLSFVPNWRLALSEMSRSMKPGARLLMEVEGKWNFDMFWEIINGIGHNFLQYDESLAKAISHLRPPWNIGHTIQYAFELESGEVIEMPLRLFAASELKKELFRVGLIEEKRWGLHVLTNLIPSTILGKVHPSRGLRMIFTALASIEKHVNSYWPFSSFGCSLLVIARKPSL
jgi:ubiquinone/menaquinone biosynthesis C-methylase UbiE